MKIEGGGKVVGEVIRFQKEKKNIGKEYMAEGQGGTRSVFDSIMGMDENIFHSL